MAPARSNLTTTIPRIYTIHSPSEVSTIPPRVPSSSDARSCPSQPPQLPPSPRYRAPPAPAATAAATSSRTTVTPRDKAHLVGYAARVQCQRAWMQHRYCREVYCTPIYVVPRARNYIYIECIYFTLYPAAEHTNNLAPGCQMELRACCHEYICTSSSCEQQISVGFSQCIPPDDGINVNDTNFQLPAPQCSTYTVELAYLIYIYLKKD
jgi:hypothetical protein